MKVLCEALRNGFWEESRSEEWQLLTGTPGVYTLAAQRRLEVSGPL
jgi:hypothetical protein